MRCVRKANVHRFIVFAGPIVPPRALGKKSLLIPMVPWNSNMLSKRHPRNVRVSLSQCTTKKATTRTAVAAHFIGYDFFLLPPQGLTNSISPVRELTCLFLICLSCFLLMVFILCVLDICPDKSMNGTGARATKHGNKKRCTLELGPWAVVVWVRDGTKCRKNQSTTPIVCTTCLRHLLLREQKKD